MNNSLRINELRDLETLIKEKCNYRLCPARGNGCCAKYAVLTRILSDHILCNRLIMCLLTEANVDFLKLKDIFTTRKLEEIMFTIAKKNESVIFSNELERDTFYMELSDSDPDSYSAVPFLKVLSFMCGIEFCVLEANENTLMVLKVATDDIPICGLVPSENHYVIKTNKYNTYPSVYILQETEHYTAIVPLDANVKNNELFKAYWDKQWESCPVKRLFTDSRYE